MIELPPGLAAASEPFIPDVRRLYWLKSELLGPGDPEDSRPGVVISAPDTVYGTVIVVTRSTTDSSGVAHDRQPSLGLNKPGHFSRLLLVQCQLWTPNSVHSFEMLDQETFAWILQEFNL